MHSPARVNKFHLWVHLQQTYALIRGCAQDFRFRSNITIEQFAVLWNIKYITEIRRKPVILTDLVSISLRNINSVSEIVNRMEKLGLLQKIKDLPDQRNVRLVITHKGEKAFTNNSIPNFKLVDRIFSTFNDNEVEIMLKLIKKLRKWILQDFHDNRFKWDPMIDDPANIDKFLDKLL